MWNLDQLEKTFVLAWPVLSTFVFQFSITTLSVVFVGHLGTVELAAASLGTMCANIMGFSVGIGFASAMDTLCSQAYGREDYLLLGTYCQRCILILGALCIPLGILWSFTTDILIAVGQDAEVAALTGVFMNYQLIGLFPQFLYTSLNKYLQTQGITRPSLYVVGVVAVLNPILMYVLIYPLGWGFDGAALAVSLCRVLQAVLLGSYIYAKGLHHGTWGGWSRASLEGWGDFLSLGFPGCVMICSEWWASEILTLAAGWISTTDLAAQSVIGSTMGFMFAFPLSFSIACSIRVGNNLGAGEPREAQLAWRSALQLTLAIVAGIVLLLSIFSSSWAYAFTNDPAVAALDESLFCFIGVYALIDAIQIVAAGALRGCGHQRIGALCNLFSYYVVGLPLSMLCAFHWELGIYGLWIGNSVANVIQASLMITAVWKIDWKLEVHLAKLRSRPAETTTELLKSPINILDRLPPSALTPTAARLHVEPSVTSNVDMNNILTPEMGYRRSYERIH